MNSFWLKLLAVITMIIDHIGCCIFPDDRYLRMIGRISFPIYCFLLVEGFFHTKNSIKYLFRLLIFAILSEIPFDLAFHNNFFYMEKQNVFWTLSFGLLMLILMEKYKNSMIQMIMLASAAFLAWIWKTDYRYYGIFMIYAFYLFRFDSQSGNIMWENRFMQMISIVSINLCMSSKLQWMGSLSLIPIQFYNGEKGKYHFQILFYIFYPLHLILLFLIKRFLL